MVTLEQFRYLPSMRHARQCFDFHYSTPGIVAIVGDNGSGKSTLAQLLTGWYRIISPAILTAQTTARRPYRTPAGRTVAHHPAEFAIFTQLSGCTFSVEEEGGVWPGESRPP